MLHHKKDTFFHLRRAGMGGDRPLLLRADWLRIFFHLNGPGLRGANPAAQIFYVFGRGYLTRARGGCCRTTLNESL